MDDRAEPFDDACSSARERGTHPAEPTTNQQRPRRPGSQTSVMVRPRIGLMSPRKVAGGGRRHRRVVATLALVAVAYGVASLIASVGGDDDDWATEREANVGLRSRLRASADRFARVGGGDRDARLFRGVGRADAVSSRRAGGYDGTHQGGLANFGGDDEDARASPDALTPTPTTTTTTTTTTTVRRRRSPASLRATPSLAEVRAARRRPSGSWTVGTSTPRFPIPPPDDDGSRRAPAIPLREPFPLRDVRLLPTSTTQSAQVRTPPETLIAVATTSTSSPSLRLGAYTRRRRDERGYLLDVLDHRRLLANFRDVAKLPKEKGVRPYCDAGTPDSYSNAPGACWEAPDCELRGHFVGHPPVRRLVPRRLCRRAPRQR